MTMAHVDHQRTEFGVHGASSKGRHDGSGSVRIPPSFFGIPLGLSGLAVLWMTGTHAFGALAAATLVASGAPSGEVFVAVAQEVAQVMRLPMVGVYRYDNDGLMTVIATCSDRPHELQPGTRWPLDGHSMVAQVQRTGRPARVENYTGLPGALAAGARASGLNATAGAPIIVNGSG